MKSKIYREYRPPLPLRSFVECFWSLQVRAAEPHQKVPHRILPDGCVDIIYNSSGAAAADFIGCMTVPQVIALPNRTDYLGVRFRPGGAFPFFRFSMKETADLRLSLSDLRGRAALREFEEINIGDDLGAGLRRLSKNLCARVPRTDEAGAPVGKLVSLIEKNRGNISIERLSRLTGLSRQHLTRKFGEQVGLSPKKFARIVRLRSAIARARRLPEVDWATLALDCGFYDQAHLIAEFKEIAGLRPVDFLSRKLS